MKVRPHLMGGGARTPNNRKKDASRPRTCRERLKRKLASSRLPRSGCSAKFICGNRDDFFAVDVSRHCFARLINNH